MSVNYFNKFPKISYDVNNDGDFSVHTDITKTVDINVFDENNITYYTFLEINDGERPDNLSYRLYGTPQYYWTFFVINDELKAGLNNSWPLNSHEFENMIIREYDNYSAITFNPILHNSLGTDNRLSRAVAEQMYSDFSIIPFTPINNLLTSGDDKDEYLPYLRLISQNIDSPIAKILKYDSSTYQLVIYDIRDNVKTCVEIINGGSGYVIPPTVTFDSPPIGGVTAKGVAVLDQGVVTDVLITDPGSGYISNPIVKFDDPPLGGVTATGISRVSKPTNRELLLNEETFKLVWVNPYNPQYQTNLYNEIENIKKRFVDSVLNYFEPIDQYYYPGRVSDPLNDIEPKYSNDTQGREKYVFDKNYLKILNTNTHIFSWSLYRNATAQYTSKQTFNIDGETVTTTTPLAIYDVLYPQTPIPIDTLSFYEKEEIDNSNKRKIKIIRPETINRFSKNYFDLLNG